MDTRTNVDPVFILNEKNILINSTFINKLFKKYKLHHKVIHIENYVTSMTHISYSTKSYTSQSTNGYHKVKEISAKRITEPSKAVQLMNESYERFEFLGDSIIHAVLAEYIFRRFPDQQEGFMTKLRTKLENSDTLAKFSRVLGLDNYVLLSRYMEETDGRYTNTHILEDVFEAFIGALYVDVDTNRDDTQQDNYDICKYFIVQLIEAEIDIADMLYNDTNYKDMLLQYAHTKKWPDPVYGTQKVYDVDAARVVQRDMYGDTSNQFSGASCNGKSETRIYEMYVKIGGKIEGVGKGISKKKGEQQAAELALKKFRVLRDDDDDSDDEYICE